MYQVDFVCGAESSVLVLVNEETRKDANDFTHVGECLSTIPWLL